LKLTQLPSAAYSRRKIAERKWLTLKNLNKKLSKENFILGETLVDK